MDQAEPNDGSRSRVSEYGDEFVRNSPPGTAGASSDVGRPSRSHSPQDPLSTRDPGEARTEDEGEGGNGEPLAPGLEDLPVPGTDTPGSLIGSTPATRETSLSDPRGHSAPPLTAEDPLPAPAGGWHGGRGVSLDDLDELTIVARAQDGDLEAFDWLITAYQGGVYRLCLRMLNDRSDAEDIVQETFITAWRSLPNLTVPQAFIPWLYRTATNKCLDDLRRRQRRPSDPTAEFDAVEQATRSAGQAGQGAASGERPLVGAGPPMNPAQEVENRAQMQALADLLQSVSPGLRACWLLREVHGFSYGEIAAIVQLPESTIRGRIARAKRYLAEGMEPWR